ncbi:MAG TPA: RDD family protein [Thermoanaerobaculia bacterium]|nr:RDD family protein [Thermoanaerobaculia bacterium]
MTTDALAATLACRNHSDVIESLRHCTRCGHTYCADCLVDLRELPYCASCKNEQLLDIASGVEAAAVALATSGRRAAAMVVDSVIVTLPPWIVALIVIFPGVFRGEPLNQQKVRIFSFLLIALYFVYDGLMTAMRGQTLGKMVLKIKVVQPDGSPVSPLQAWARALVRAVISCIFSLIDYIPGFFTKEKTCIHDMLAKTRVVHLR